MLYFAMFRSYSIWFSCSKACYLIWYFRQVLISLSLRSVCHLHFCHACLNLLMDELAVAQCSSFVKHHERIPAMYFVAMFEWCSIFVLMHLEGYLLIIADRCHICFACHLQTMHPFLVIFISISTEIISSFPAALLVFQVEARFNLSLHCILHPAYHAMFCIMLLAHCRGWLRFPLFVFLLWVEPGDE